MIIVICPGIHPVDLTDRFLEALRNNQQNFYASSVLTLPTTTHPPFSALHSFQFLAQQLGLPTQRFANSQQALFFIGFSAGVVGAIGAAWLWQQAGGKVQGLMALDGWGMPLFGNFPIHRVSHDYFTHWSSDPGQNQTDCFYADPPVAHLDLWQFPQKATGWCISGTQEWGQQRDKTTAIEFIASHLPLT
jgi:hypothetical protein